MNWVKPEILRSRRKAEKNLLIHGDYEEGYTAVWSTDGKGNLDSLIEALPWVDIKYYILAARRELEVAPEPQKTNKLKHPAIVDAFVKLFKRGQ